MALVAEHFTRGSCRVTERLRRRVREIFEPSSINSAELSQFFVPGIQNGCLFQEDVADTLQLSYFANESLFLLVKRDQISLILGLDVVQTLG